MCKADAPQQMPDHPWLERVQVRENVGKFRHKTPRSACRVTPRVH